MSGSRIKRDQTVKIKTLGAGGPTCVEPVLEEKTMSNKQRAIIFCGVKETKVILTLPCGATMETLPLILEKGTVEAIKELITRCGTPKIRERNNAELWIFSYNDAKVYLKQLTDENGFQTWQKTLVIDEHLTLTEEVTPTIKIRIDTVSKGY